MISSIKSPRRKKPLLERAIYIPRAIEIPNHKIEEGLPKIVNYGNVAEMRTPHYLQSELGVIRHNTQNLNNNNVTAIYSQFKNHRRYHVSLFSRDI